MLLQSAMTVLLLATLVRSQGATPSVSNDQSIANNGFTKLTTISFRVTGSKPGFPKLACALDQQGYSTCQDPQTYTSLPDNTHTLKAAFQASDGTVDTTSVVTFTWTVDTVSPSLVFTNLPFVAARPKTNSRTVTFIFDVQATADKVGVTYTCSLKTSDSTGPPTSVMCNAKTITFRNLGEANGEIFYNFTVTATDRALNSKTLTSDFSIDTEKPLIWLPTLGASFLTLPTRYTNKTSASFPFSTNEVGQVSAVCRRDGSGQYSSCPTKPYTSLSQGEHSLEIQVTDWAGNIQDQMFVSRPVNYTNSFAVNSTTNFFQWRVDTTAPPKPQITIKPNFETNIRMPVFKFSVAGAQIGGISYSCRLALTGTTAIGFPCYENTVVGSTASPIMGVPTVGLTDGPNSLRVNAIDAAGNHGPEQMYNFTVDLRPPSVTLDSTTPSTKLGGTNNSPTMTFNFHAIDQFPKDKFNVITRDPCLNYNCTMQCSLDGRPLAPCNSPITFSSLTPAGSTGPHTFRVVATDNATNVGLGASNELTYNWITDRIYPTTTIFTMPAKMVNATTATFQWRTTEPAATPPSFMCSLDLGARFNCTSTPAGGVYTWTLTKLSHNFNHRFDVIATDFYGNTAPTVFYTWEVDLHDPVITFDPTTWATQGTLLGNPILLVNASYSRFDFVQFVFSTEPGSVMECKESDLEWAPCVSPHTMFTRKPSGMPDDGPQSFRVRAIDPVMRVTNYTLQPAWEWTLDTVGPNVTFNTGPDRYTNKLNATFLASADEPITAYQCEYRSTQFQGGSTSWLPCQNPPFSATIASRVLKTTLNQYAFSQTGTQINFVGDHAFMVRGVDRAGNVGMATSWIFTVDLVAPTLDIAANKQVQPDVYSSDFRWSRNNYALFEFDASERVTYTCWVTPNTSWVNPLPCRAPSYRLDNIDEPGDYTFTVSATDLAGNHDPSKSVASFTWTAAPMPPVTSIVRSPNYYVNVLSNLNFSIATPVPRVRAMCTVDRLFANKTVWLAGIWYPCIDRSQTMNSPASVWYSADLEWLLNTTLTPNPDSIYNFKAQIIDVFNRTSAVVVKEFVVDTIPPQTALEGTTPYSTSSTRISFKYFTNNPVYLHDTFQCQLKLQDSRSQQFILCATNTYFCEWMSCGGTTDYENAITGLSIPGKYQFSVRAVDKAGNWDESPIVTTFKYDPIPPTIRLTGVQPSNRQSMTDTYKFSFSSDEGSLFRCSFSRSDDPASPHVRDPCFSPESFEPPAPESQRNNTMLNFTVTAVDPYTRSTRSYEYVRTLYNTSSLEERVAMADARTEPIVCTNNNTIYFILTVVFLALTIIMVIAFVVGILRKMENQAMGKSSGGRLNKPSMPMTSFNNPQFGELHET